MRFVLASGSPARLATLRVAGLDPEVIVSDVDEDALTAAAPVRHAGALTMLLATAKAEAVSAGVTGEAVVLGCDSLLSIGGRALGKPGSAEVARARWAELAGGNGMLATGHCLLRVVDGTVTARAEEVVMPSVFFAEPSPAELDAYLATGEADQVAGGFTVDGLGGWFVESVVDDHHAVVGVSLRAVRSLLAQLGLSLLDVGWPAVTPRRG